MPGKKPAKKSPSKKEIEEAAASVEAAIEKLEESSTEESSEVIEGIEKEERRKIKIEESEDDNENLNEENFQENSKDENFELEDEKDVDKSHRVSDVGTVFSKTSYEEESNKNKSTWIIVVCLIIIFTLLGFVGGYFYGKSLTVEEPAEIEPTPTLTPIPTMEEIDLSAYSIEILNGSGVAGVAGNEQEALEEEGFSVGKIGNAANQNFSETIVAVKSDVPSEFVKKLKDSLSERYVIASGTEDLEDDNDYDVVITIGSKKTDQ